MTATTSTFTSDDGTVLGTYSWLPDEPRGVVQITHGMGEHSARYDSLASRLVSSGWAVHAHDHRGHGRSVLAGEEPGHLGDHDTWNRCVRDLHLFNRHVAEEHPGLPHVVLGHSMGSFMTQQLMYEHADDMDAVVLSATNGKPPLIATLGQGIARAERVRQGPTGKSHLINAMTFGDFNKKFRPTRTDFDWLSRDDAEVDKYIDDPLCGFIISNQSWVDMLDALPKLTRSANLARLTKDKPVYAFAGARDAVGDMGRGVVRLVDAYRAAWLTKVEYKLYDGGRHEMLNETNSDQVIGDLLEWIERAIFRSAE